MPAQGTAVSDSLGTGERASRRCPIANDLIEFVARAEGMALALVALVMVFAESAILVDFLVPGEVGLVVAGAAAAHNDTPRAVVILAAAVGALAGDSLGYWLGRRFGPEVIGRWRWARRLQPSLRRARRHFDRHGGRTVAIARWIGARRRPSRRRFRRSVVPAASRLGHPFNRGVDHHDGRHRIRMGRRRRRRGRSNRDRDLRARPRRDRGAVLALATITGEAAGDVVIAGCPDPRGVVAVGVC